MWSKNKQKWVRSLAIKKYRDREGCFIAEGPKVVEELLVAYKPLLFVATHEWAESQPNLDAETYILSAEELARVSLMQAPQQVLAVFHKPTEGNVPLSLGKELSSQLVLLLDGIQDPGNLGTIVRVANWFGITHLVCSPDTADVYSPKVVQATMGALSKVGVHYTKLTEFLDTVSPEIPIYGTFLEGKNIYEAPLTSGGLIIMGNEGQGISPEVAEHVNHKLYIPPFPLGNTHVESLNVAIATAITIAEFRRRK